MASQIPNLYIDQFAEDLVMVSQQKKSRLYNCLSPSNIYDVNAESFSHDFIGLSADFVENTDFYGDSVETNTAYTRRWGSTIPYEWGEMVSEREVKRIGRDPKSKILDSAAASRGRKIDDVIIGALTAPTALTGIKFGGASGVAFAGTTIAVDHDVPATAAGLTQGKIRAVTLAFNEAEIDPSLKRYMAVSAEDMDSIAASVDIYSKDYEQIMEVINYSGKEGKYWNGFNWIITERLPIDTGVRTCIAFTEEALALGNCGGVEVEAEKRGDRKFNWYTQITQDIGAVRGEDIQTVWVLTDTAKADFPA